jgi:hypothetical protein
MVKPVKKPKKTASEKKYRVEFHVRIDARATRFVDKATRDMLCEADDEGNLDIDEAGLDLFELTANYDSIEVSVESAELVKG